MYSQQHFYLFITCVSVTCLFVSPNYLLLLKSNKIEHFLQKNLFRVAHNLTITKSNSSEICFYYTLKNTWLSRSANN